MKKFIGIISLTIVIALSLALFASCRSMLDHDTNRSSFIGEGLTLYSRLIRYGDKYEPSAEYGGTLTLDGVDLNLIYGRKDDEFYLMDRDKYLALDKSAFDLSVCIWNAKVYIKNDKLYLTVTRDFLFERGESQVDHTGVKYVLDKYPCETLVYPASDDSTSAKDVTDGQEQTETSSDGEKE